MIFFCHYGFLEWRQNQTEKQDTRVSIDWCSSPAIFIWWQLSFLRVGLPNFFFFLPINPSIPPHHPHSLDSNHSSLPHFNLIGTTNMSDDSNPPTLDLEDQMADLPEDDDIIEQHPANDETLVSLIALNHAHDTIKLTRSKTTLGRSQGIDALLLLEMT